MSNQILIDIDATGHALISTGAGSVAVELAQPLGAEELEDLRWYLEDYLQVPYGVYEDRGSRIAGRIAVWGQAMVSSLLGSGPASEVCRTVQDAEIVVRSAMPTWLELPWELMRDPRYGADPVALGSLIVSAAALAWTIYRDLCGKTPKPSRRTVGQRVRLELPVTDPVPSAQRDRIIEVIVEEIVQDAEEDELGSPH